jgi:glutaredoxin
MALAAIAGLAQAQGQIYTWKDEKGVTHFSDHPPPKGQAAVRKLEDPASPAADLPYALARAVRQHPVTLYTMADCVPCDDGRKLLRARGVPFAEKTVATAADRAALRAAGGNEEMPYLLVGRAATRGYQRAAWQRALDAAGYPAQARLPAGYVQRPPEPAGGPPPAPATRPAPAQPAPARPAETPPPPRPRGPDDAPPGFIF